MPTKVAFFCCIVMACAAAWAHGEGTHKKDYFVITQDGVEGVSTLEFTAGRRAEMLRLQADENHDKILSDNEKEKLKVLIQKMIVDSMHLSLAGYDLVVEVEGAKLNTFGDNHLSRAPISVAARFKAKTPTPPKAGMKFVVNDVSPDRSHLYVEVSDGAKGKRETVGAHVAFEYVLEVGFDAAR